MARPKKQKAEPAATEEAGSEEEAPDKLSENKANEENRGDDIASPEPMQVDETTPEKPKEVLSTSSNKSGKKKSSKSSKTAGSSKSKQQASPGSAAIFLPDPPKKKKGRPPKVDPNAAASIAQSDVEPPKSASSQDQHPFARSSVIEVWHGVEDPSEDSWWTEDSSDSDTEDVVSAKHHFKTRPGQSASVKLCDVIDRVPVGEGKWRYYVHYRDLNRRMDEWVSMERIVSPPSVGNAKARALKAEEEKQKKREAREKEAKEKARQQMVDVTAPRASRRRSLDSGPGTTPSGERSTRKQRRRSMADDEPATVSGDQAGDKSEEEDLPKTVAEKGIVALPTEAVHTTAVGEHVVETIAAQELDEHEGLDEAALREHEEVTKVKNVAFIELGAFQMETWYFSPLPKELLSEGGLIEVLYVCEFTLNLFSRKSELRRFQSRLPVHARHPPGNEIYRNGNLAMFEVDGFEERIYCQNLCYIAKLFLDHKTLYFDVDPFLFYVLCEVDDRGFHPVGYYSKEKYSDVGYNLACILTFPCHQRKGYGRFLIAFSYELSKKEEKVGSPEKPMSDLGQQAYKPYWASTIVDFLLNEAPDASSMSIMDISKITSIMAEDIVFTLNQLGILKIISGVYFIAAEKGLLETLAKKYPVKEPRVDPSKLHWSPFLTDVKRDKFSIHSKKPNVEGYEMRGSGGFP